MRFTSKVFDLSNKRKGVASIVIGSYNMGSALGENIEFGLGHVRFRVSVTHLSGAVG